MGMNLQKHQLYKDPSRNYNHSSNVDIPRNGGHPRVGQLSRDCYCLKDGDRPSSDLPMDGDRKFRVSR